MHLPFWESLSHLYFMAPDCLWGLGQKGRHMSADTLLSHLDGVRRTGPDRWLAKCPAHKDRTASLSIRELDDGRTLVHCFAGCEVHDVLASVGIEMDALFPPRPVGHQQRPERRPFPAADVLRAVAFEALVVSAAAAKLLAGEPFGTDERERLILAAGRINSALHAAGLCHA